MLIRVSIYALRIFHVKGYIDKGYITQLHRILQAI